MFYLYYYYYYVNYINATTSNIDSSPCLRIQHIPMNFKLTWTKCMNSNFTIPRIFSSNSTSAHDLQVKVTNLEILYWNFGCSGSKHFILFIYLFICSYAVHFIHGFVALGRKRFSLCSVRCHKNLKVKACKVGTEGATSEADWGANFMHLITFLFIRLIQLK